MAQLSDADKRAILGATYKEVVVTQANLDDQRAAKRVALRNTAIGIAVVIAIILVASFYRS